MKKKTKQPAKLHTWHKDNAPVVEVEFWRIDSFMLATDRQIKVPRGDIESTYCADTLAHKKPSFPGWFLHNGLRYVNTGGCHWYWGDSHADCYELVEVKDFRQVPTKKQFCYSGTVVAHKGRNYVLVRPIIFTSRPFTIEEMQWHIRRAFALRFHSKRKRYEDFIYDELDEFGPDGTHGHHEKVAETFITAAFAELELIGKRKVPQSAADLRWLCGKTDPLILAAPWSQQTKPSTAKVTITASADDLLAAMIAKL